jgi:hypothetical protein
MAHGHHTDHVVRDDASAVGLGLGFIVAFGTIILLAVLALAILFAVQPWDSEGGVTPVTDETGGGSTGGDGSADPPAQ